MSKSAGQHIGDALKNAVNFKKIAEALLRGGWKAAAMEALKRYWPQILAVTVVLVLLPVIIFVSVPTMLFGGHTSDGLSAEELFLNYDALCDAQVDSLITKAQADPSSAIEITGEQMPLADFKALLCVLSENDMCRISSDSVTKLVTQIIICDTYELPEDGVLVYEIQYLSMEEYMERTGFSDSQKDWAKLLQTNILTEENPEDKNIQK